MISERYLMGKKYILRPHFEVLQKKQRTTEHNRSLGVGWRTSCDALRTVRWSELTEQLKSISGVLAVYP